MPKKKILQDMVPSQKSSLKDAVPLSVKNFKKTKISETKEPKITKETKAAPKTPIKRTSKKVILEREIEREEEKNEKDGIDDPIDVPEALWREQNLRVLNHFNLEELDRNRKSSPDADLSAAKSAAKAEHKEEKQNHRHSRSHHRNHWVVFATLIVSVVVIAIAVSFVFAKATVVVTPKTQTFQIRNTFTACKDTPCGTNGNTIGNGSELSYQILQIPTVELHQTVPATAGPYVQTDATGGIILYNNYSTAPQTLVSGTRLTNTAGFVYRTTKTVVIPGMTKSKTATTTTPGSVAVKVVASAPGPQYNIQPTDLTGDFQIAAYKGTAKYATLYGRLNPKGSISGGYLGQSIIVSSSTLLMADTSMKSTLASELTAESQSLVPQGYVLYNNAYVITYNPVMATSTSKTTADVGMRATFYGMMFKTTDLVQTIASATVPRVNIATAFPNQAFTTKNLQSLVFNFSSSTVSTLNSGPVTFMLTGAFTVVGTFPPLDIAKQLAGKNISDSQPIFAGYGTITSAHAIITPFWRHSFPDSPDKITVVVQQ